jgi:hypothetical protein
MGQFSLLVLSTCFSVIFCSRASASGCQEEVTDNKKIVLNTCENLPKKPGRPRCDPSSVSWWTELNGYPKEKAEIVVLLQYLEMDDGKIISLMQTNLRAYRTFGSTYKHHILDAKKDIKNTPRQQMTEKILLYVKKELEARKGRLQTRLLDIQKQGALDTPAQNKRVRAEGSDDEREWKKFKRSPNVDNTPNAMQ